MNADDMMKEYDAVDEEEEDAQWTIIKMEESTGRKNSLHPATHPTKIHLHFPQVLKSSIQATAMSHHQFQG
jgi:hypothetical protein